MEKRIKTSVLNFVILGAMNGAIISLITSYFIYYIINSYTTVSTLSFLDWLLVLTPCFAIVGALFNAIAAILIYEEPKKDNFLVAFAKRIRDKFIK